MGGGVIISYSLMALILFTSFWSMEANSEMADVYRYPKSVPMYDHIDMIFFLCVCVCVCVWKKYF